jgi:hypothetical protein
MVVEIVTHAAAIGVKYNKPFSKTGLNFFKNDTSDKPILDKDNALWVKYRCMKILPLILSSFIHTHMKDPTHIVTYME